MSLSILKSPRKRNNLFMCIGVVLLVVLVLWFVLGRKQECPKKHKIIVPIGNGQKVALTKEEYEKLTEKFTQKENFYVSSQDYIPNVRTENEYAPMLSLYKPKEATKVEPTPMVVPTATGTMVVPAKNEPFGNVFIDNIIVPPESEEGKLYRAKLAEMSPFFLNNGEIIQA